MVPLAITWATTSAWEAVAAVAQAAAALGTFAAVWVALKQSREAGRVRVRLRCAPVVIPAEPERHLLALEAMNDGPRPVKIEMGYFMMSDGYQAVQLPLQPYSDQLPKVITEGESVNLFYDRDDLEEIARKQGDDVKLTYAFVFDSAGRVHAVGYPGYEPPRIPWPKQVQRSLQWLPGVPSPNINRALYPPSDQ